MTIFSKALIGTVAAGAMAISSATPAFAQSRHHDNDRISTGEVVAGAVIIGGIAALAASSSNRNDRHDRNWRGGNPRQAVEQCVASAERQASRFSYRGRADVTDVRKITRTRNGYEVRGRIAVNTMGRDWRRGDANYGRGWNNDNRGWNNNLRGYDAGNFTCRTNGNRVAAVNFSGIRGLR